MSASNLPGRRDVVHFLFFCFSGFSYLVAFLLSSVKLLWMRVSAGGVTYTATGAKEGVHSESVDPSAAGVCTVGTLLRTFVTFVCVFLYSILSINMFILLAK